ncbi:MAG: PIN domain-containing protein [Proteobacteria bacterium]|jgi:uncharacterized protein|nr:PIN domain-containing protein [Pseudomonadota bacterium]
MIIADTGYWLALANRRDRHHARAVQALEELDEALVTTWPVMTETCHLLLNRLGVHAQTSFVLTIRDGACDIFELQINHLPRLVELMLQYQNLPMDLADASLVVLAEKLGTGRILSTDRRDFGTYRWKNRHPFSNMLLD